MRVLGGLGIRWSAFFSINEVKPLVSAKHCDHHVISRKKETIENGSAEYVVDMKCFYNVPTLSQFRL